MTNRDYNQFLIKNLRLNIPVQTEADTLMDEKCTPDQQAKRSVSRNQPADEPPFLSQQSTQSNVSSRLCILSRGLERIANGSKCQALCIDTSFPSRIYTDVVLRQETKAGEYDIMGKVLFILDPYTRKKTK